MNNGEFSKLLKPGRWYTEFDEKGQCIKAVYELSYCELLGFSSVEEYQAEQTTWEDGIYPNDLQRVNSTIAECVGKHPEGMDFDIEYRAMTKNGYRWFHNCAYFTRREDGSPIRCDGVAFDIDEFINTGSVRNSMDMMLSLTDEFDPVVIIDPETGEYDWLMSQAADIDANTSMSVHGDDVYQNIGIEAATTIHEDEREEFKKFYTKENLMEIARTGKTKEFESRWFIPPENRYRWKYNKAVRMVDETGKAYVVIGVIDTTEEKAQQRLLKEALDMAQAASKAKTTFLNSMSHDIRTPMNAIIGFTDLAQKHIDDQDLVLDYLQKIDRASDHLLSLINDVLDMSRIESGKVNLDDNPESISQIINSLKDIAQADITAKKHTLTIDTTNIDNENIICDKLKLNQVLLNILSNSIKYTPEGGEISIVVNEKSVRSNKFGRYEIIISDNGMGMDKKFMKSLFEPFTRVKSSTVSGIQGTGLGMAITKSLVDMMGGKITVKSKPDKGTTTKLVFDFKLQPSVKKVGSTPAASDVPENEAYDFKGKKVLLVEDNELNQIIAVDLLEEAGFVVSLANDGDVAVDMMKAAKTGDYDLCLMDIQMPNMNGYEATRRIRALKTEVSKIPILAMTANAFEEDRQLALEAGMDEHIAKPIKIEALESVLAKFV